MLSVKTRSKFSVKKKVKLQTENHYEQVLAEILVGYDHKQTEPFNASI